MKSIFLILTEDDLDWHPQYNDEDMLKEAYQMYKKQ